MEDVRKVFDIVFSMVGSRELKDYEFCEFSLFYVELEVELLLDSRGVVIVRVVYILIRLIENGFCGFYVG